MNGIFIYFMLKIIIKCKFEYFGNLLTYNNPIIGFWLALKFPSRRLCFAAPQLVTPIEVRSSSTWSLQRVRGRPTRRWPPTTAPNTRFGGAFIHPNDINEPAEPMVINTLSNIHVIEELIQLPVGSETVVMANSYWTKNYAQHFSLEHS